MLPEDKKLTREEKETIMRAIRDIDRQIEYRNAEIEREQEELEEAKAYERILKGQEAYKKSKGKEERPILFMPTIKDGKIQFSVVIPVSWLRKYLGKIGGVDE